MTQRRFPPPWTVEQNPWRGSTHREEPKLPHYLAGPILTLETVAAKKGPGQPHFGDL